MLDSFLNHLQFEKRYSTHTIKAYQNDLLQFSAYLSGTYEQHQISEAAYMQIRSYMALLMDQGITARSIQRKLTSLRTFFTFLQAEGIVAKNPLSRVRVPKASKRLPSFIEEQYMMKLNDNAKDQNPGGFSEARNKLILTLLYHTGMRLSELVNLRTDAIDLKRNELKVLGKRKKERIIPITAELGELTGEYLELKK
jgi:integrase/recombinase XerC